MTAIMGWILVAVWITPLGDIEGEAIDYFYDADQCFTELQWEYENTISEVGFTCVPDLVPLDK